MDLMQLQDISPDQVVFLQWGPVHINATLVYTWGLMALMVIVSWLITRRLSTGTHLPRSQNLLEVIVDGMRRQIAEISGTPRPSYLYMVGTLFLFILVSNLLTVVPGYLPPTASLSTATALAMCVFVAVPVYGIMKKGVGGYLRSYMRPTPLMLPFNIMGELSRTLALAVRLFGNIMSGMKVGAILLSLVPLFFPVVMHLLGLLTGTIQAYIFAVLAMVYIASATRVQEQRSEDSQNIETTGGET